MVIIIIIIVIIIILSSNIYYFSILSDSVLMLHFNLNYLWLLSNQAYKQSYH